MYRIYKTEHFQKRPRWIIPLLVEISTRKFLSTTREDAREALVGVAKTIRSSKVFGRKMKYKVITDDDSVSVVNESGSPYLTYRIEEFESDQ